MATDLILLIAGSSSGDTSPTDETIKACDGCDVLIHDAQTLELYAKMPERLHSFVTKYHTTTEQLAALATEAKPKLLVVYHTVVFRPGRPLQNFCRQWEPAYGALRKKYSKKKSAHDIRDNLSSGETSTCTNRALAITVNLARLSQNIQTGIYDSVYEASRANEQTPSRSSGARSSREGTREA